MEGEDFPISGGKTTLKEFAKQTGIAYRTAAKYALADEVLDHRGTKRLLTEQVSGTAMYQRIAESAGLIKSDREDMLDIYRRR